MSKKYSTINTLIYCLIYIYLIWEIYNASYVYHEVDSSLTGFWSFYRGESKEGVFLRCIICLLMFLLCLFLPRINKVVKYLLLLSMPFICGVIWFCVHDYLGWRTPEYHIEDNLFWSYQDLGLPSEIRLRTSCSPNDTTIYNLIDDNYYDEYISEEKLYAEISEHCYVVWEDAVTKFTGGRYFAVVSMKTGNYILLTYEFIKRIFGEDVYYENIGRFGYYGHCWNEGGIYGTCDTAVVDTTVVYN